MTNKMKTDSEMEVYLNEQIDVLVQCEMIRIKAKKLNSDELDNLYDSLNTTDKIEDYTNNLRILITKYAIINIKKGN